MYYSKRGLGVSSLRSLTPCTIYKLLEDSAPAADPPEVGGPGPGVDSSLDLLEGGGDGEEDEEEPAPEELTAPKIVERGLAQGQLDADHDQRDVDAAEEIIQWESCKCDFVPNSSPCSASISVDHFRSVRSQMSELTHDELDLVVMGQVMAGCFSFRQVVHHLPPHWHKDLPSPSSTPWATHASRTASRPMELSQESMATRGRANSNRFKMLSSSS